MLTHLDHVIVGVRDLTSATKTLAALLGRGPSWRGGHPALGTANSLFRLDNTYVELLSPVAATGLGAIVAERIATDGEGVLGLAFRTPDAVAYGELLRSRGLEVALQPPGEGRDEQTGATRHWRNVVLSREASRGLMVFAIQHLDPEDALPLAPVQGPAQACVHGLDHVVVVSGDLEATRALYGEKLGLRQALDRVFEDRKLRLVFFRVGGVTVEVAHRLDAPPEPLDHFMGLSFQVRDAEAARERVAAAGFDVSPVRPGLKPGTRVCTVRGKPLGVDTLLIEPLARPPTDVR